MVETTEKSAKLITSALKTDPAPEKTLFNFYNTKKDKDKYYSIYREDDGSFVLGDTYIRILIFFNIDIKISKCGRSRAVKIEFEEDETEKLHTFTIFSNVIDKVLNLKSAEIPQPQLRAVLLSLPEVEIVHTKNIIQTMKIVE